MGNVTIGQISAALGLLCGVVASVEFMYSRLRKWLGAMLAEELEPVKAAVTEIDIAQCKNFLVRCFDDIDAGRPLNRETVLRLYEVYDRYTKELGQNSYIHERMAKFEQMEKEEK